ncbi:GntR family transcriptional regulator [Pseudonocardia kunmingensis]|uniref:GntR family transcriptional regulator n=1 Tax=Pseudonocardia kunmingensis TaxID=630975 RepID=A0A543DQM0_9PSEU|nr:GntR family transcriptional regulator [Pseudonocardia kunmingensis]
MPVGVKVRTLPMQVAARLVERIATGGPAPSELEISQEFGVSRIVARETLKILASLDIVDIAQGRRVAVRPPEEWDYLNPLLAEWLPEEQVVTLLRELHQVRLLLEPELAAMAAANMTDETLARLRQEMDRMTALTGEPDHYLEADHAFHMEICRAANNRILDRIMYSARWLGTASRRVTNAPRGSLHRATDAHARVLAALEARDPEAARAAMRDHLHGNIPILAEKEQRTKRASAAP